MEKATRVPGASVVGFDRATGKSFEITPEIAKAAEEYAQQLQPALEAWVRAGMMSGKMLGLRGADLMSGPTEILCQLALEQNLTLEQARAHINFMIDEWFSVMAEDRWPDIVAARARAGAEAEMRKRQAQA